jgi:peptidoglycan hydrolase FlgJ
MDTAIQSAATMAQQAPLAPPPRATANAAKADAASKEYESIFISQFLGSMFSGIQTDPITGGGQGEEMYRSLMINEFGKSIEKQGGFGLAAHMKAQLLKNQEGAAQ